MRYTTMLPALCAASLNLGCSGMRGGGDMHVRHLFNGKDLSGWEHYLVDANVKMSDVWSVEDGLLVCKGEPMGYLATEDEYTSYKLIVEWRWAPGTEPGNSGVLMRITGKPRALPRCLEAQLQHGNAGDLYGFHGFAIDGDPARKNEVKGHDMAGDLTGVSKMAANENAAGEWNRYDITLQGDDLTVYVNGQKLNEADDCEVIAGKIGLQSEGGVIHFRTVDLIPL